MKKHVFANNRFFSWSWQCNKFVDSYGPVAIKYLINEFDKIQVCNKLRLCKSNAWIKNIFTAEEAFAVFQQMQAMAAEEEQKVVFSVGEAPYCGICQYAIASLEQYVNSTESQIEQEALKLCKKLPAQYEQLCDTMVLMYLPNIIDQLLANEPPHKACCQLTLCHDNCNATSKAVVVEEKKAVATESNDGNCAVCQFMVGQIESYLEQNTTQEAIIKQVNLLCSNLPTQYAQICVSIADGWVPYVIYYIEQNFPADKVCQLIGACPTTASMIDMTKLNINVLPSQKKPAVAAVAPKDSQYCSVCTLAMTMLQQYVNSNSTDQQIKQALEGLCQKVPNSYSAICTTLVDTYEPVLISLVRKYIAEHQLTEICHDIGLCSSAKKQPYNPFALTNAQKMQLAQNENSMFCSPCLAVVSLAEQQLSSDATRAVIKEKLMSLCDEIPSEQIAGLCKIVVAGKTDELIDGILSHATPSEVCTFTGLCSAKKQEVALKNGSPVTCGVCKEVVSVAVNYINSNSTITQIKNVVENVVCTKLPDNFKNVCELYVETYANQLIAAFAKGVLDPDHVCQLIGACSSKAAAPMRQNRIRVN